MAEEIAPPQQPAQAITRIVFFCKDCEKIVDGVKIGRKYVYKCPLCSTKNVAFGTEKSIRSFSERSLPISVAGPIHLLSLTSEISWGINLRLH